ncbi:NAD-dependent epimerase/dehydratase family protein [soil metagenome]
MRVVITGVTSFVGYHLAAGFLAAGHEVTGVLSGRRMEEGIVGERIGRLREQGIPLEKLDLLDAEAIGRCAETIGPEVWIQHAGYTKNYASFDYDLRTGFAVNVLPLTGIFTAMSKLGGAVIVTGTVSEYSDADVPHEEEVPCVPKMPYGLAKLAGTLLAKQLAEQYGVPTRVARLFLPFGPLDAPEKLLAVEAASLAAGQPVRLSPCLQRRDFLYVDDVVSLYLALLRDLPRSHFEIYNVCAGEAPELREVLLEMAEVLGADPALCEFGAIPLRAGEPKLVAGSNAKARKYLEWKPMGWREGVRRFAKSETGCRKSEGE